MGNCCTMHGSSSAAVWAGDDWGPIVSERPKEKEGLLLQSEGSSSSSSYAVGTTREQVRIRITKKKLEELLKKMDQSRDHQGSTHQVLQKLIDESYHLEIHHDHDQRSWRPVLQSIPEVD